MNRTQWNGPQLLLCGILTLSAASLYPAFADAPPDPASEAPKPAAPDKPKPPAVKPPAASKTPAKGKPAETPPTMAEIQKSFDEGNYEQTLQLVSKVLPLKGKAAADYDRYKLLMLKACSHLKIRAPAPATTALGDAAEASDDPKDQAIARATQTLIKRSKGLVYTTKSKKAKSPAIDITDPAKRQEALEAMWADDLTRAEPKLKAASDARTLPPIADALEEVKSLHDEELAATGSNDKTKEMANRLTDRGFSLMDKSIKRLAKRTDEIAKAADTVDRIRIKVPSGNGFNFVEQERRHGLRANDIKELRDAIAEAPPIAKAADELSKLADQKAKADPIIDGAKDIVDKAKNTLERG